MWLILACTIETYISSDQTNFIFALSPLDVIFPSITADAGSLLRCLIVSPKNRSIETKFDSVQNARAYKLTKKENMEAPIHFTFVCDSQAPRCME